MALWAGVGFLYHLYFDREWTFLLSNWRARGFDSITESVSHPPVNASSVSSSESWGLFGHQI